MTGSYALATIDLRTLDAAAEVRQALTTIGGFRCVAGDAATAVAECRAAATAFFGQPEEELFKVRQPRWDVFGGYVPFAAEGRPNDPLRDPKRSFCVGPEHLRPDTPAGIWPDQPVAFRAAVTDYYRAVERLARTVRRALSQALWRSPDRFELAFEPSASLLKLIEYPVLSAEQDGLRTALRAGEHTDFEFLTVLWQQDRPGGLQMRAPDHSWFDVPADEDGFVVTAGDLLANWTHGEVRAVPHRVITPPTGTPADAARISFAYFHQPAPDTVVAGPGGQTVSAGAYLEDRFLRG